MNIATDRQRVGGRERGMRMLISEESSDNSTSACDCQVKQPAGSDEWVPPVVGQSALPLQRETAEKPPLSLFSVLVKDEESSGSHRSPRVTSPLACQKPSEGKRHLHIASGPNAACGTCWPVCLEVGRKMPSSLPEKR